MTLRLPGVMHFTFNERMELALECDKCRGTGFIVTRGSDPDYGDWLTGRVRCECHSLSIYRKAQVSANIPPEFRDAEKIDFSYNVKQWEEASKYAENPKQALSSGSGLFLFGENGVGKTSTACMVLNKVMKAGYSGGFITSTEYINTIIPAQDNPELGEFFEGIVRADFLVLDEMGKEYKKTKSDYVQSQLDSLVRWRRSNSKPTIICTNLESWSDFTDIYGESLSSIMQDKMKLVRFGPGDYRRGVRG